MKILDNPKLVIVYRFCKYNPVNYTDPSGHKPATKKEIALAQQYKNEYINSIRSGTSKDEARKELLKKNVELSKPHEGDDIYNRMTWWKSMVETKAIWDYKNRENASEYVIEGERSDDWGNYHYGYVGSSIFDDRILKLAAGGAQLLSDTKGGKSGKGDIGELLGDIGKFFVNLFTGNWGDNPGDSESINEGFEDYVEDYGNDIETDEDNIYE